MQIGFIGAGRVGCSIGKYMKQGGLPVAGYVSRSTESAEEAGTFTGTKAFGKLEKIVEACDVLCIATPDGAIAGVWEEIRELPLEQKILCHFSGSYSSDVFSGIEQTGASACSVHPMYAFSDKFHSYQKLNQAYFTIEGAEAAVTVMKELLSGLGNSVLQISSDKKALYHCGATLVSNAVAALYQTGLDMMGDCGIGEQQANQLLGPLVAANLETVLEAGPARALTGPVERGDVKTVEKHLSVLEPGRRGLYLALGRSILRLAQKKHTDRDYAEMEQLFQSCENDGCTRRQR